MSNKPVFLFTFANDDLQSLKLDEEWKKVEHALENANDKGRLTFHLNPITTKEDIWDKFNRFHNDIAIFHYGGHSDRNGLDLKDTKLKGQNLAELIGQEKNLKLVFLNGCQNVGLVKTLFDKGVPAVIATSAKISDQRAIDLATQFYKALNAGKSIDDAFNAAKAFVNNEEKETLVNYRGILLPDQATQQFEWGLYVKEENSNILNWKIPTQTKKEVNAATFQGSANIETNSNKAIPNFYTPFPTPAEKIIGRADELNALRKKLTTSHTPVLLCGMGGLGKTRLAIEYTNQFQKEYDYIVWIDQLGELSTDLTSNSALNEALKFQATQDPAKDVSSILFALTKLEGNLLLIIDNTDEQVEAIASLLPKAPNAHVLLTARQEMTSYFSLMRLGFLEKDKARELFYTHYKREKNDDIINDILEGIDYHTLTIELFSKTANRRKISLKRLKALLEERGLALGKKASDIKLIRDPDRKLEKIIQFMQLVFDIGELDAQEKELLQKLTVLPPIFIPLSGISYLLNIDPEEEEKWDDLVDTLTQIQEKGWLIYEESYTEEKETTSEEAYKMHRAIQEAVWNQLEPTFDSLVTIFEKVTDLLRIDDTKDNPIEKFPYIPFAERLLKLYGDVNNATLASIKDNLGGVYKEKGRYQDALSVREDALSWYEQEGVTEDIARVQSNLALVYKDLGRYAEAASLLEKAVLSYKKALGEEHAYVATTQSNLALVYKALGRYAEAAGLLEEALASAEQNFGSAH
ncbi:MAG: tetratricopeptide repeat protein, partial [Bacteroidota bacterium]